MEGIEMHLSDRQADQQQPGDLFLFLHADALNRQSLVIY